MGEGSLEDVMESLLEPDHRTIARLRLASALQENKEAITREWCRLASEGRAETSPDLQRYLRSLISGLTEIFRDGDWGLMQTVIDGLAERRARESAEPEQGFQRALIAGRHAIRPFLGQNFAAIDDFLLETLHECVFRYFESYQGTRLASENDRLYTRIIKSLVAALEARDPYTKGHSISVALLCQKIATALGANVPGRSYLAGLLHDVGKVGVPDSILSKPSSLDENEWEIMKKHPLMGANILRPIKLYPEVVDAVLAHHENFDGTGYPNALAGEEIPLSARVIRVVDSFEAMTSTRVYRASRSVDEAMTELKALSGTIYDPKVVDALDQIVCAPEAMKELSIASLQIDVGSYSL
jgi:putative nucleotidyltransferase with HDIG domain